MSDDHVEVPQALAGALESAGVGDRWDALPGDQRRRHAEAVATADDEPTRQERIAGIVAGLETAPD